MVLDIYLQFQFNLNITYKTLFEGSRMLDLIKQQKCSDGSKGWPVAVKDRIAHFSEINNLEKANVAVTFLWTIRDNILPKLEKENIAIASNFYTPSGLVGMVRNILANPYIRYTILVGNEYSSVSGDNKKSDLTSANALRAFFEKGINEERKIPGFESSVYFDKNIPTDMIKKVIENVELIDINKKMPNAGLNEKINEINSLLKTLEKKQPFLDKPLIFDYEQSVDSFPYEGGPLIVHGSTIPKAWINMINALYRHGRKNLMNANTDRWVKEINNMVVVVHDSQNTDLSINPFLVPLTKEKIEAYQKEILSPLLPEGKAYTYGNKLRAYIAPAKPIKELVATTEYRDYEFGKGEWLDSNVNYLDEEYAEVDQIKDIVEVLKRDPYSKACVAITWHVQDELMKKHKSSPCLVFLQALVQDERLNLTVFFRSHDMTQGWPENTYGCAAIQKEIADGINVKPGILTMISGSAQIYNHYYAQVEEMLKKYKKFDDNLYDPKGNYLIEVKGGKIIVTLIHPDSGKELEKFEGNSAYELRDKIAEKAEIKTGHAIYLGTELLKAEQALKNNAEYGQDVD